MKKIQTNSKSRQTNNNSGLEDFPLRCSVTDILDSTCLKSTDSQF